MTIEALKKVVTQAVVSDQFRNRMFTADRAARTETLRRFPYFAELDGEEVTAILEIQAKTPEEFYAAMTVLIQKRERGETLLPPLSG